MSDLKSQLNTIDRYITTLANNGIITIRDFLSYFPRTHEDRSSYSLIKDLDPTSNETQTVVGNIIEKKVLPRGKKKLYEIAFQDTNGDIGYIVYFNTYYQVKSLTIGNRYVITGKCKFEYRKRNFSHPQYTETQAPDENNNEDDMQSIHDTIPQAGRIYPIYSELNGIKPHRFVKKMRGMMDQIQISIKEYLPQEFLQTFDLMDVQSMFRQMHFPDSMDELLKAKRRFYFDKLLRLQLYSLTQRSQYESQSYLISQTHPGIIDKPTVTADQCYDVIKDFLATLPFELTTAQKKVIKEMVDDLVDSQYNSENGKKMMRLLQGDVGSGKTVVAATLAYIMIKLFHQQVVFLAPLSILAKQHHASLAKLFLPLGITVDLLSGSRTKKEKDHLKEKGKFGQVDIIVATHAVLQDDVEFSHLGLVIIDEQHKFGVRQRAFFSQHGYPHIIQMSATPIPRSMALAFFGEFDVSIIDELPAGRKAIQTKITTPHEYSKLIPRIHDKLLKGQKLFIVVPLIEESEKLEEVHNLMDVVQDTKDLFAHYGFEHAHIAYLHGKMKSLEKDQIMNDFSRGKYNILISTTVIEVGVDIREATMILIKNSERFGLAQLHQLRGRIGRNDLQSYCFLETKSKSGDAYTRLQAMEKTNDGFELAKIDLEFRGSGEVLGTRQSGESDIPPQILGDIKFIEQVRIAALRLLDHYPGLEGLPALKTFIEERLGEIIA